MKAVYMVVLLLISPLGIAAQLSAENGMEILVVNGKDVDRLGGNEYKLDLSEGTYQVVARYESEVKRGSKNVIFTSKPYVFEIEIGTTNLALSVPQIKFESQATSFFRSPDFELINLSTGQSSDIAATRLTGTGFGAFNNMEKAVATYNQENGIVFEGGAPKDLEEVLVAIDEKGNVAIKGDTLTQLQLWYTKATTEEKKDFKRWMIDQDF